MSLACSLVCTGIRRSMLCILLLSGLCLCLHHYHFIHEPKTWKNARRYCREKYTDLATIDNLDDMERLIAAAGSGHEGNLWIGLHDKPRTWGWSLKDHNFYETEERGYRRWTEGEPNNTSGRGKLCVAFQQGFWYDYSCNSTFTFICYDNANQLDTFIYINRNMTWEEAQLYCRENHTDLASVRNDTENEKIQSIVPDDQTAWIGLSRLTWAWWSDYTINTFENWADGHPIRFTGNCVTSVFNANHTGTWVENDCDETFHFMCHNKKKQLFNVKLTALKSTIDLNYPAVTEAILNLIEERMKENYGIKRDFKIAWIKKPNTNIFHKEEKDADVVNTDL